jgi:hypothetical protein
MVCVGLALSSALAMGADEALTIRIKADGSSEITFDRTQSRTNVEREVQMWERFQQQEEDAETVPTPPALSPPEAKAMTDEELGKKLRKLSALREEQGGGANAGKITLLNISSNDVRLVTQRSFSKLEELLPETPGVLSAGGLLVENVRLELTNQLLVLTLSPSSAVQSYGKRMFQSWKLAGGSRQFRIELPGKVMASGFPETSEQATWFKFDASKTDAIETVSKLHQSAIVVTAHSGGLKLTQPLDATALRRVARTGQVEEIPITDAEPGFTVEAASVSTTVIHRFPEAPALPKGRMAAMRPDQNQPGTFVRAKLFAPKGRTIRTVSGVRVLKAVDDRGRAIPPAQEGDNSDASDMMATMGRALSGGGKDLSLRLQLPAPDARSIEELTGEAIVVSNGRWKEIVLTNLTETSTNEVDLSSILPGARFTLTKLAQRSRQSSVHAKLAGPPTIRDIEVELVASGRRGNSNTSERNLNSGGGQSTRTLQIEHYSYDQTGLSEKGPITLRVRYPEDRRRERVQFVLRELDLL